MPDKIMLKNVRLSFPSLWKKATFDGKDTKFEGTFLIPKKGKAFKKMVAKLEAAIEETRGKHKLKSDRIALKDGDDSEYDGYEGHWSLKAANNVRPTVINKDRSQLDESDGVIYSGCYVNAIVEPWFQDNSYGKRVNFNLLGVQFAAEGEAFSGGGTTADADDFSDISDDDDF